jgi:hypothetical protein
MNRLIHLLCVAGAAFALLGMTMALAGGNAPAAAPTTLGDCPMFPADNVWNTRVDGLPVDANSNNYVTAMGASSKAHADFGSGLYLSGTIGIPFIVVPATQTLVAIHYGLYGNESDPGPYPIPPNAPVEYGSDHHVLVVRQGECKLYELFNAVKQPDNSWNADSGAVITLTVNGPFRMATWTSADAAGLPMLPGLARYDEVAAGEINHALRFTSFSTRAAYIWPALHQAASHATPTSPPMGQRFRLKASFAIDGRLSAQTAIILRALKRYGMILADNGTSWYISGAPDPDWDNTALHQFDTYVKGSDFEAVDESALMIRNDSGQVWGHTWLPIVRRET